MVKIDILDIGKVSLNGEIIRPSLVRISEYYEVEKREGTVASYAVPFERVHFEDGVLSVDNPKFEKRANEKIKKIILGSLHD